MGRCSGTRWRAIAPSTTAAVLAINSSSGEKDKFGRTHHNAAGILGLFYVLEGQLMVRFCIV